ncbi:MAG TPA: sugar phosphate nucleotidyltransferase [Chloroflexota bacterium]|nr:sugar phosphate nucleotidyltransferase [Chloroflexota bacterium]
MKAVVMAGGEGSRLRPLTLGRPKPMVPLVNRPMLEHILLLLKRNGITEVVLTVQYMASYIQDRIGDGNDLGMRISYSVEDQPLGTAGSVRQAADSLDDTFLVISGDALTDFDLNRIVDFHREANAMATLTLYRVASPLEYGVVVTGPDSRVREFQEKPSWSEVLTDTINTGIYVLEPSIFEYYERDQVFDFSKDLFPLLLKDDRPLYGYVAEGYWTDVGSIEEYVRATRDVLAGKVAIAWGAAEEDAETAPGIRREQGVAVDPGAILEPPIYLGRDVRIAAGSILHGPTVVGDNCVVERHAHLDRSIIWRNSYLGTHSEIRGSLLGAECNVRSNTVVFENAVIGDGTVLGRGAIIQPNVKIWPHKEIEAGAVVSTSIIWGSGGRRVLYGRRGVTGLINTDFTPESLAKLGSAYASTLPLGAYVTINRDLAVPSRMLKRALGAGLPSAGANVMDLSAVPIPVARFYTGISDAAGGVHVRISSQDRSMMYIAFFDRSGMDLDKATQRKVETAYFREDFRRAHVDDIGITTYAPDVIERYCRAFTDRVDRDAVARSGYRLVVDYSFGATSEILPGLLRSLGCHVIDLNANQGLTRTVRSFAEYATAYDELSRIISALDFDLGFMLDVNGERLEVVDGNGRRVSQMQVLGALADLVFRAHKGAGVAVPVDAPSMFDTLAAQTGGKIIRTRVDTQSLMAAAAQKSVRLGGDGRGRTIFPELHPAFDAMFTVAKLLELLSLAHIRLDEVVAGLPRWHVAERDVACPWDRKGRVMRMLGEQYRERRVRTPDGIKIPASGRSASARGKSAASDEGGREDWVLILPDPDEPQFHLVAEAQSDAGAQALVDKYAGIVTGLQV